MKISELIDKLCLIESTHGDLAVATRDPEDREENYIRIVSSLTLEEGIIDNVVVIL